MAGMMAKLAAAEAEAEKLRTELKTSAAAPMSADEMFASRVDELSKQTPAKPKQRIDGGVSGHGVPFPWPPSQLWQLWFYP